MILEVAEGKNGRGIDGIDRGRYGLILSSTSSGRSKLDYVRSLAMYPPLLSQRLIGFSKKNKMQKVDKTFLG